MKKFKSMLAIMMAMACVVSFVSCGDDDDDNSNNGSNNGGEEVSGIAKTIEGEYTGDETITVMGSGDTR